jgi:hypothetical protein
VFLAPRPVEEFYHTADDPHQLRNLANDPAFAGTKARLAGILDRWIDETGDAAPENLSRDSFDRETGRSVPGNKPYRGDPPGAPRDAIHVNRPGPR